MKQRVFAIASYPFVLLLTAFVSGIVVQQQFPLFPGAVWISICGILSMISILFHLKTLTNQFVIKGRSISIFLSFFFLGTTVSFYHDVRNNALWYGHSLKQASGLQVLIIEPPIEKPKTTLILGSVLSIRKNKEWITANGDLKIYVYKKNLPANFKAGQTILISNELTNIQSTGNPFSFDQAVYANRNGIYHQCFLGPHQIQLYKSEQTNLSFVAKLRQAIKTAIHRNVKDSTTQGLIDAMLINDRFGLDPELQQAYTTTGIIHILAISGMHVILLAGIILWLLGKVPIKKAQESKHLIALILVWIYIAITGFPPSANRAAVTFSIYTLGILLNKDASALNTWSASGFLLIFYNPHWIYDVGFQLSFLAVLSILLFNPAIVNWWKPKNYFLKKLWELIAISISVQILVFPLVIYYFNQFPILGFLANIPAGLYSSVLMIGSIIIFVGDSMGISCLFIGQLLSKITDGFNVFILLLSKYSAEGFRMLFMDFIDYWLMMLAITFFCLFCYFKSSLQFFIGLSLSIILIVNFIRKDINALEQEKIVVYNLSKESQIDLFKGKSVGHVYTINEQQYKFTLKPSLLGFRANEDSTLQLIHPVFLIHHKRVFILGKNVTFKPASYFPIDILIVSNDCIFEPEQWFETLHPKKIIIDGSLPRWKAEQWKKKLQDAGAKVHWVGNDNAWIYPLL